MEILLLIGKLLLAAVLGFSLVGSVIAAVAAATYPRQFYRYVSTSFVRALGIALLFAVGVYTLVLMFSGA